MAAPIRDPSSDTPPPGERDVASFERIDWTAVDDARPVVDAERTALVAGLLALVGIYLYDRYVAHVYLIGTWKVAPVDWLAMVATVVIVAYGVVPLRRNPEEVRRVLARLLSNPVTAASGAYIGLLLLVGLFGSLFAYPPYMRPGHVNQPPLGFTVTTEAVRNCAGAVTETPEVFDVCHGSILFPFGTDYWGRDMLALLVSGARVVLYVTVVTVGLVIPVATVVGAVAGYRGGLVDDLLMAYVDAQLTVPALVVYLVLVLLFEPSLLLLLVVFGLLSWGSVARAVRSETLQRRESGFVRAARGVGARDGYVLRRHVLPNVTNTVVPSVAHLIAVLVLTEAGIAFLGFHDPNVYSWGATVADGLDTSRIDIHHGSGGGSSPLRLWWISTVPAVALALTVFAFKSFGDGLRDAMDPRGEG